MITLTLAIPRAQVLLAAGHAAPDARQFEVSATAGAENYGILSNPFVDRAFKTLSFRMHVVINDDDTWSYDEAALLEMPGVAESFTHRDRNTLSRLRPPTPNPMAQAGH